MSGMPAVEVTVYPYECDAEGHLSHAACLTLLERARWEAIARSVGADLFRRNGVWPAARHTTVDYRAAAYPGDVLRVETATVGRGITSFTLQQRAVRTRDDVVIVEAELVFVCIDRLGRATPVPEEVSRLLGAQTGGRLVRRVAVPGGELAVEVRGTGSSLVLVHGFPFDRTLWRHQLAGFSRWQRIAPDLRGFGASAEVDVVQEGAALAVYADDLAAVLDALGVERAVLCGQSMGGYILFEFLRRHRARIRALILMDTRAEADTAEGRAGRDEMAAVAAREGSAAVAERMLPKLLSPATSEAQSELVAAVRDMIGRAAVGGIMAALRAMRERRDSREMLSGIDVPVLALVGAEDQLTPPAVMRELAQAVPGARFATVPAAGHLAPLEQPLAVNRIVGEFLAALNE